MLSSKARSFVRRAANKTGISTQIGELYLIARAKGFQEAMYLFPDEYAVLDEIPLQYIQHEKLDPAWVTDWIDMWPKPSDTGLTYSVSGNAPEVKKRFRMFFKEWSARDLPDVPWDKKLELVVEATEKYLQERELEDWAYTKKNHKFIKDNNGSALADQIEMLGAQPLNTGISL